LFIVIIIVFIIYNYIYLDMNKPNGQTQLKNNSEDVKKFMDTLSIGKVSGIGKVAERTLNELGIKTCGEMVINSSNTSNNNNNNNKIK